VFSLTSVEDNIASALFTLEMKAWSPLLHLTRFRIHAAAMPCCRLRPGANTTETASVAQSRNEMPIPVQQKPKSGEPYLAIWLIVQALNMTALAQAEYKAQARIIKALAHPTRLFIVDELSRGERCVCDLTDMIGVEMPTVSRHLSQLRNAGILEDEKRGSQVFYRLRVPCVLNFFKCVKAVQAGRGEK
jgi:DNA-binding transcriptional ArsR family regulator